MGTSLFSNSKHFTLQELAKGVFAAIAIDGGAAICNAGVVDLGGQLLVFDTFLTPQAAQDLRTFAMAEFGMPPQLVVNSHYHNDHTWGNQVFEGEAQFIASIRTRQLMETEGKEELRWYAANALKKLEELREKICNPEAGTPDYALKGMLGYYEGLVEALPTLKPIKPGITFDKRLELSGSKRSCALIAFEGAHSGSDTILVLPKEKIIFAGDLLFTHFHPWLLEGDPDLLLQTLNAIEKLQPTLIVPGHGPLGTLQDLQTLVGYVEQLKQTARSLITQEGNLAEQVHHQVMPVAYQDWQMPHLYHDNLSYIAKRLRGS